MKRTITATIVFTALSILSVGVAFAETGIPEYDILTEGTETQHHDSVIHYENKTLTISHSNGGSNMIFMRAAFVAGERGDRIVIDGNCVSACTLLVDKSKDVCLTDNTKMGYHKFSVNFGTFHFVPSGFYREEVMQWVTVNIGWGEGADVRYMDAEIAQGFYGACE